MDGSVQFCISFFIFVFVITKINTKATTHLIVTRIGPCEPKHQYIVNVSEFKIFRIKNSYNFSITGMIDVKVDIQNGWTVKMKVEKCVDIRNQDTCELFKSLDLIKDGCNNDGNFLIRTILDNFQPSLTCPITAGEYRMLRYPFITKDHFRASKTTKASGFFGYSVVAELHDDTATYGCVNIIFRLWYVRKHDWGAAQSSAKQSDEVKPDKSGGGAGGDGDGDTQVVLLGEDLSGFTMNK